MLSELIIAAGVNGKSKAVPTTALPPHAERMLSHVILNEQGTTETRIAYSDSTQVNVFSYVFVIFIYNRYFQERL
jgi:hypothetical protein